MFAPLIALSLFAGVVWVIAYAIFLVMRRPPASGVAYQARDTITRFVEENYGSRFVPDEPLSVQQMRRL
jgi:hypothetical protein